MHNTYSKSERVVRKDEITKLLSRADGFFYSYPVSLHWVYYNEPENPVKCRVLIVVPKKIFKKAHDRNKVKRKLREAFRVSKHQLLDLFEKSDKQVAIALIYKGKSEDIAKIPELIPFVFSKFVKKV